MANTNQGPDTWNTAKLEAVEAESIEMTPDEVKAAISGFDVSTYRGWMAAAHALLADKPTGTALKDSELGYMVLIEGRTLCAFPANRDGSLTFVTENGFPLEGCDPDESAWNRGAWELSLIHISEPTRPY